MPDEKALTSVDVEKVSVEKLVLPPAPKHSVVQGLLALTPLLSIFITGMALVVSAALQVYQNHSDADLKIDSEWRNSIQNIEKLDSRNQNASLYALEMQSFFESEKHSQQARSLAAGAIPNIDDKYEFDTAYFVQVSHTGTENQNDLVTVARSLANQMRDLYALWVQSHPEEASNPGRKLEDFVVDPEHFFNEQTESPALKVALSKAWELESASKGLSLIWNQRSTSSSLQPSHLDLSGLIFLNSDFENVDFSQATLDNSRFVGGCAVNKQKLPPTAKVLCPQVVAAAHPAPLPGVHPGSLLHF